MVLLAALGVIGWFAYPLWKYRLPQERDLADQHGTTLHVRIESRNESLVKYTDLASGAIHYVAIANLAGVDREFIGHLSADLVMKLPLEYTMTDAAGVAAPVRLVAHNAPCVQYILLTNGSTHYVPMESLSTSDQLLVNLFQASLYIGVPVDYILTGSPSPGAKIHITGRDEKSVNYVSASDGKNYTESIDFLSSVDQAFVRTLSVVKEQPQEYQVTTDQIRALVYIEGDESAGSGFITKIDGQFYVVTNQHVLSGNKKFTITAADGTKLPTNGTLYGAVDRDVALIKIPDNLAKYSLKLMEDPQSNAKVGDTISVVGNTLGARVPTQFDGRLLGIGPELIEVNAQFQPGNSGSPIFDRATGDVIAMASLHIVYDLSKLKTNQLFVDTRWFGYRLDNIDSKKGWRRLDWNQFSADGLQVNVSDATLKAVLALVGRGVNDPATVENESLRKLLLTFQANTNAAVARKDKQEYYRAVQTLNGKLRTLVDSSTKGLTDHVLSAYQANVLEQQQEIQKYLDDIFVNANKEVIMVAHDVL